MKKTNSKLKTKVLIRAVSITALLLVAGVLFTGCPQKVKEEPKPVYYTVSLVHEGGSLTANPVLQGGKALKDSEITFTASPANTSTHMVDKWDVTDGQIVTGGNSGDTSVKVKITGDTTVKVTFKKKMPSFTAFNIPKAGISKANTMLIARISGAKFKEPGITPADFTVTCTENSSIIEGSAVTILSDTELTVSLKIPGDAGDYTVTITSGDQSLNGTFSVKDYTAYTVGKIVLKDGTLVAKDKYGKIDSSNPPVAVLIGSQNIYGAALGIALHISEVYLIRWAKYESTGYNTKFKGIICTPSITSGGAAQTATFTGDTDGSNNWDYICSQDPNGTQDAVVEENYPAFHWVNKYNTRYSTVLAGADIKWYMPSLAELCEVYKNKNAINASLARINGLNSSYADSSLGTSMFWSSSQSSSHNYSAWGVGFLSGYVAGYRKDIRSGVCCLAGF